MSLALWPAACGLLLASAAAFQDPAPGPGAGPALPPPVNSTCPVLEDELVDPAFTVLFEGVPVGLCCEMCVKRFNRDPERYVAALPELASAVEKARRQASAEPAEATEHGTGDGLGAQLGRFHPLTTHFPIALLLAAGLGELLVLLGAAGAASGTAFALRLGTLGAVVAAPLGLVLEGSLVIAESLTETVEWHERLGITTAALAVLALVFSEWSRRGGAAWTRSLYRALLFASVAAVVSAGHLGATLVFGQDYLPF